jgi:hypothetical protein
MASVTVNALVKPHETEFRLRNIPFVSCVSTAAEKLEFQEISVHKLLGLNSSVRFVSRSHTPATNQSIKLFQNTSTRVL